ncbi:MAG: hypothetical protein R3Y63_15110, partial [Eubacteriales bacterium]
LSRGGSEEAPRTGLSRGGSEEAPRSGLSRGGSEEAPRSGLSRGAGSDAPSTTIGRREIPTPVVGEDQEKKSRFSRRGKEEDPVKEKKNSYKRGVYIPPPIPMDFEDEFSPNFSSSGNTAMREQKEILENEEVKPTLTPDTTEVFHQNEVPPSTVAPQSPKVEGTESMFGKNRISGGSPAPVASSSGLTRKTRIPPPPEPTKKSIFKKK